MLILSNPTDKISVMVGSKVIYGLGGGMYDAYAVLGAYDPVTIANDIGLLFLETAIPLNTPFAKAIALPSSITYGGGVGTVTGWGANDLPIIQDTYYAPLSAVLYYVDISVIDHDVCKSITNPSEYSAISDGMLCAGSAGKARKFLYFFF